jgi:glycosyltransferase involved in cell wall biosynthesis
MPKVSVITPTYKGALYLGETIQSVLAQTYADFELIIIDDASPDNTAEVVGQFHDQRIKYLVQEVNRGADAARLIGIHESSGEIIALLDQDDLFHPEKLQAHVSLFEKHPEVGFSYNSRFELYPTTNAIREIWRPPKKMSLADLVLGFPLSPSDMVFRRNWISYLDLSREPALSHGGEYVVTGRLFMSGCKFGCIDRALNYRRNHFGRNYSKLYSRCEAELSAQQRIFTDSRCPVEVIGLRDTAFMNTYRIWAYYAFLQNEIELGQDYFREAVRLKPDILKGIPCELVHFLLICSIDDESLNHETILKAIFSQFPPELPQITDQLDWAVTRGYLLKGVRAIIWDRINDGRRYFEEVEKRSVRFDEALISQVTQMLLNYEQDFGETSALNKIQELAPQIEKMGGQTSMRQMFGCYFVNRAFNNYSAGERRQAPKLALKAIKSNPKYIFNRGVLSVIFRSIFSRPARIEEPI